jgi:hypothetical protein
MRNTTLPGSQYGSRIHERTNIEFRAQALDVFNWTNFLPGANIGSTLGQER